jgi:hypothetical protein
MKTGGIIDALKYALHGDSLLQIRHRGLSGADAIQEMIDFSIENTLGLGGDLVVGQITVLILGIDDQGIQISAATVPRVNKSAIASRAYSTVRISMDSKVLMEYTVQKSMAGRAIRKENLYPTDKK